MDSDDVNAGTEDGLEGLSPLVRKLEKVWQHVRDITDEEVPFPEFEQLKPSIAVIGTQGSGKSSVLESIMKSNLLPLSAGTMTRCPLVLQLHKTDSEDEYVEFKHSNKQCRDISDVKNELETLCLNKVLSDPITLNLFSRNDVVSDIAFIDLPGFTEVAVGVQPDSVIQNTVNMAKAFIKKPNCIILVVSPVNEDPVNSNAITISHEVDPEGQRTFGVLTKVDLVENFTDVLEERNGQYKFPWICVCNRSQQDIESNVDIAAALPREHDFFAKIPDQKHAPSMGSEKLIKSITKVLKSLLTNSIREMEAVLNPDGTRFVAAAGYFTVPWIGLPKSLLAPMRDQGRTKTCSFQAAMVTAETHYIVDGASKTPPEVFSYKLSLTDFQEMHKEIYPNAESDRGNEGGQLSETMRVLKEKGVYGNHVSTGQRSAERFKIKNFRVYTSEQILRVAELLDNNKVVAAKFPCSDNFFDLQPREVFQYNHNIASRTPPPRQKIRAHCVMIVGYFPADLKKLAAALKRASDDEEKKKILVEAKIDLAFQNSYSVQWGDRGFGFVDCSSVRRYYLPILR